MLNWKSRAVIVDRDAERNPTWRSIMIFFFSSRRRHTRLQGDWSSDVCSSDLPTATSPGAATRFPPTPTRSLCARRVHCQIDVRASNLFRGGSHNATQEDEVEEIGRASCRERV